MKTVWFDGRRALPRAVNLGVEQDTGVEQVRFVLPRLAPDQVEVLYWQAADASSADAVQLEDGLWTITNAVTSHPGDATCSITISAGEALLWHSEPFRARVYALPDVEGTVLRLYPSAILAGIEAAAQARGAQSAAEDAAAEAEASAQAAAHSVDEAEQAVAQARRVASAAASEAAQAVRVPDFTLAALTALTPHPGSLSGEASDSGAFIGVSDPAHTHRAVPVKPGSRVTLTAGEAGGTIAAVKTYAVPQEEGEAPDYSDYPGWERSVGVAAGQRFTAVMPADAEYLLVSASVKVNGATLSQLPAAFETGPNAVRHLLLGDGITAGRYSDGNGAQGEAAERSYGAWMAARTGFLPDNRAVSGCGWLARGTAEAPRFNLRAQSDRRDGEGRFVIDFARYDIVTVMLGANDWRGGAVLGPIAFDAGVTPDYQAVTGPVGSPVFNGWYEQTGGHFVPSADAAVVDGKTYYTTEESVVLNMRYFIETAQARNPALKIVVVSPFDCRAGVAPEDWGVDFPVAGRTLEDYYQAMKAVCAHYGVQFVDMLHDSPVNRLNRADALPDGVHPSPEAHRLIGLQLAERVLASTPPCFATTAELDGAAAGLRALIEGQDEAHDAAVASLEANASAIQTEARTTAEAIRTELRAADAAMDRTLQAHEAAIDALQGDALALQTDTALLESAVSALQSDAALDQAAANGVYPGRDLTQVFREEIGGYDDEWQWLHARVQAGNFAGIRVGDYIPVTCSNGFQFNARVAGVNTYKGSGSSAVPNHIDFFGSRGWPVLVKMNPADNNNGISGRGVPFMASNAYYYLNSEAGSVPAGTAPGETAAVDYTADGVYSRLPAALRAVITAKRVNATGRYSATGLLDSGRTSTSIVIGKLWLPFEPEVSGCAAIGNLRDAACGLMRYPLFQNWPGASIGRASDDIYWLASAAEGDTTGFVVVRRYGDMAIRAATTESKLPICFRVT